uniref:Uncharacterized protein n=1 Tax=Rhizophora mucronata TaxID=61149 RepID=A0A2P2N2H0_RHIMU
MGFFCRKGYLYCFLNQLVLMALKQTNCNTTNPMCYFLYHILLLFDQASNPT